MIIPAITPNVRAPPRLPSLAALTAKNVQAIAAPCAPNSAFVVGSCLMWLKRHDIDYSMTTQFCVTPAFVQVLDAGIRRS
jgi:hypothetical protein